jgi:hypothetical protein
MPAPPGPVVVVVAPVDPPSEDELHATLESASPRAKGTMASFIGESPRPTS